MKIDRKIWIPLLGLWFARKEPLLLLHRDWIRYQMMCFICTCLSLMPTILRITS